MPVHAHTRAHTPGTHTERELRWGPKGSREESQPGKAELWNHPKKSPFTQNLPRPCPGSEGEPAIARWMLGWGPADHPESWSPAGPRVSLPVPPAPHSLLRHGSWVWYKTWPLSVSLTHTCTHSHPLHTHARLEFLFLWVGGGSFLTNQLHHQKALWVLQTCQLPPLPPPRLQNETVFFPHVELWEGPVMLVST